MHLLLYEMHFVLKKGSKYDICIIDRKLNTERQSLKMIMNSSKDSKQLSMKCPCKNVK